MVLVHEGLIFGVWFFFFFGLSDGEGAEGSKYQRTMSMPASPTTPATPVTPTTPAHSNNVWRSVFNPGSNLATRSIGAQVFDKPEPNSPTVYDWYVNRLVN